MRTPTSLSSNFLSSCVPLLIPHSWIYATQGTGCPLRAQGEAEEVGVKMVPTLMMNSMARPHDQLPQVTSVGAESMYYRERTSRPSMSVSAATF